MTGTLTTAHRNLKLGGASAQGNKIVAFLAATLPAAPVAIDILGVNQTAAITTAPISVTVGGFYPMPALIREGVNISIQTSTASGTVSMLCSYWWEEVPNEELN